MDYMPAIAMQVKWNGIQMAVHAAGVPYSPDLVNDLITQVNRGWRQVLKDTSEYEEVDESSEIEEYLNNTIGTLEALMNEEACSCEECADAANGNDENSSGDEEWE